MQDPQPPGPETSATPIRPRLATVAALLALLVAIAVAVRVLSPEPKPLLPSALEAPVQVDEGDFPTPPPEIPFPKEGPSPAGNVTLADVRFEPQKRSSPSPFVYGIDVRLAGSQLKLVDTERNQAFWIGPTENAEFTEETIAAVHTIKDRKGKVLWTNAKERAHPDLLFRRTAPGRAELIGTNGVRLWSGPMITVVTGTSVGGGPGTRLEIKTGGLLITGDNGRFTVTDSAGKLLWSGTLPAQPSVLMRDGKQYSFTYPNGVEGGSDGVSTIVYESEPGEVTLTDASGKTLGKRPLLLLRYEQHREFFGDKRSSFPRRPLSQRITTETPRLTVNGTVFLTYKDASGRIFRRGKVYKVGTSSGSMTRG